MNASLAFVIAAGLGTVAGLRAMTAPAVLSWAAHLGWVNLRGTPLVFMGSTVFVTIFTLAALGEYVNDLLPKTPSRTAPAPLIARIAMGALSGISVCASASQSLIAGGLLGGVGGVMGAFGGYHARTRLVSWLRVKDAFVAIPEDLVAISLGLFLVSPR